MDASKIDWQKIGEEIERQPWAVVTPADRDARPYEARRVRLLREEDTPTTEAGLIAFLDEAIDRGYSVHCPPGDGIWVSESRDLGEGR